MVDTVRTKEDLLTLFADNNEGNITAQDVRDFIVSNQSSEVEVVLLPNTQIDEKTDLAVLDTNFATNPKLPNNTAYGNRVLSVVNATGLAISIFANGAETINGEVVQPVEIDSFLQLVPNATAPDDWSIIFNSAALGPFINLEDTPDTYAGSAGLVCKVNPAEDGLFFDVDNPGVDIFPDLSDTPNDYVGHGNSSVIVNGAESGIAFATLEELLGITFAGSEEFLVRVNTAGTGLEVVDVKSSFVDVSFSEEVNDISLTQNIWAVVTEPFILSVKTDDWTFAALIQTYTGINTRMFRFDFSATVSNSDSASVNVYQISLFKNGVIESDTVGIEIGSAPNYLAVHGLVQLSTNDTLECMVRNITSSNDVGITNANLTVIGITG